MIICIDFDGTLVDKDKALPGAREVINLIREKGHKVIIHSANKAEWIEKVLNNLNIRYDGIWVSKGKPQGDCYIDNKAITFTNWDGTLKQLRDNGIL